MVRELLYWKIWKGSWNIWEEEDVAQVIAAWMMRLKKCCRLTEGREPNETVVTKKKKNTMG
jgi:hypothetical protein